MLIDDFLTFMVITSFWCTLHLGNP